MSMMQEKMYMDVDDVCAILGVSKTYAYSLMREYNKELKAKGYIVVAGKISTKCAAGRRCGTFPPPRRSRRPSVPGHNAVSRCFVPAEASWQRQRPPARR